MNLNALDLKVFVFPESEIREPICKRDRGNAGFDVRAQQNVIIGPGERRSAPLGFSVSFSPNYYLRVAPRSGLALKKGIDVLAGVVDSSYRGEICVILLNTSDEEVKLERGDRIAQLVPEQIASDLAFEFVRDASELSPSIRGERGFGSSGV